jgi:hypothetical protein
MVYSAQIGATLLVRAIVYARRGRLKIRVSYASARWQSTDANPLLSFLNHHEQGHTGMQVTS